MTSRSELQAFAINILHVALFTLLEWKPILLGLRSVLVRVDNTKSNKKHKFNKTKQKHHDGCDWSQAFPKTSVLLCAAPDRSTSRAGFRDISALPGSRSNCAWLSQPGSPHPPAVTAGTPTRSAAGSAPAPRYGQLSPLQYQRWKEHPEAYYVPSASIFSQTTQNSHFLFVPSPTQKHEKNSKINISQLAGFVQDSWH